MAADHCRSLALYCKTGDGNGEPKSSQVGCDDVAFSVCKGYKNFAPGISKLRKAVEKYYERREAGIDI